MNPVVTVDVKSAWASKVNWSAAITAILTLATEFLPLLPAADQPGAAALVAAVGSVVTIIIKTFFTTSVTPSSAAKV